MYGCAEWLGCGAPAAGAPPRSSVRACRGEGEDGVAFAAAVAAGARLHGALLEYREHHKSLQHRFTRAFWQDIMQHTQLANM